MPTHRNSNTECYSHKIEVLLQMLYNTLQDVYGLAHRLCVFYVQIEMYLPRKPLPFQVLKLSQRRLVAVI